MASHPDKRMAAAHIIINLNECLVIMLSFYDYLPTNLDSEAPSRYCQNDIFYGCDDIMALTGNMFWKSSGLFNKFEMDINKDIL
jgi:hypothetical protein